MNYYISDMHINHKNVLSCEGSSNFDGRPFKTFEEMNEAILNNWNSVVTNGDNVYLLGDTVWKVDDESIAFMSKLKGCMRLVCGNHENLSDARYRRLFNEIVDYKEIPDNVNGRNYNVVLSHFPIMFYNKMRNFDRSGNPVKTRNVHLYGHTHNSHEDKMYQKFLKEVNDTYGYGALAFNVGCMHPYMNYTPRTLEEILAANGVDISAPVKKSDIVDKIIKTN